ncbi:MAG: heme exporter protein CcmD [Candidatus Pelagibacter sp.]
MIQNLVLMGGYGLFVWASFLITFIVCALVFFKTLKTLKKYEREFIKEVNELSAEKRKFVLEKSTVASQVLSSYSKTI